MHVRGQVSAGPVALDRRLYIKYYYYSTVTAYIMYFLVPDKTEDKDLVPWGEGGGGC